MLRNRTIRAVAGAAAVLLMATACGSDTGSGDTAKGSVTIEGVGEVPFDEAAAALLPESFRSAGKVTVATNAPYAPFIDFVEEGDTTKFKGLDYDLVTAIAARLGIDAPFQQQPFDGLVPGLQAGKFDAIVGGITDNFERQEVAVFVDYSASGTGIMVLDGNPEGLKDLASLCGKEVAVQKATTQVDLLTEFSDDNCDGTDIKVTEYPQNTDALNALLAGKASAFAATQVNLVDIAKANEGKVELVVDRANPNGINATPNGIGFLKDQAELATAFQVALQSLMDDGTYGKIMVKWDQEPIAIKEATINAAIN